MQKVYLNGDIAKFGAVWETSCKTIPDIFKLIDCQTPGFRKYLIDAVENGIGYEIRRGKDFVDEDTLLLSLGEEDIIITEIPAGAKSGGAKILAAVAIVAILYFSGGFAGTGFFGQGGALVGPPTATAGLNTAGLIAASVAVNLALAGISQLLAPGPEVDGAETNENYLFNGPVNTAKQGIPVPVAYGELIVGGAPISVNYSTTPFGRNPFSNLGPRPSNPDLDYTPGDLFSSSSGSGGEDACFVPDALVTMADGSTKRIQEVAVGDEVKGQNGINTVLENNVNRVQARLYSMNSYSHFVTDTHPFLTTEGWKSFNPGVTNDLHPDLDVTHLEIGDELVTEAGTEVLQRAAKIYKVTPIFNLNVDGDDTYIVNGFVVHNK